MNQIRGTMNQPSHPRAQPIGDEAGAKAEGTDTKRTIFLSQKNEKPPLCTLFCKNHTRERPCATPLPTFLDRKVGHPAGELRKDAHIMIHPRQYLNLITLKPNDTFMALPKQKHHPTARLFQSTKKQTTPHLKRTSQTKKKSVP